MTTILELDHLAIASTSLVEGVAWVEESLGVSMQKGGEHVHFGTHNCLLGLGDIYLEVIAIDPSAKRTRPTWFGLDDFDDRPRPKNWICRGPLGFRPDLTGPAVALSRGDLRWQLTVPEDGHLPMGGAFPTLIEWNDETAHPASKLTDVGCRLHKFSISHPEADWLRSHLSIKDPRVEFIDAESMGMGIEIDTPNGLKILS